MRRELVREARQAYELSERRACGKDEKGTDIKYADPKTNMQVPLTCANQDSFQLQSRVAVTVTGGLGLNFYPRQVGWLGFGAEFRIMPFAWNTSGFDNHGGGNNEEFPDNNVNSNDRELHINSMLSVHVAFQFPTKIKTTD